MRIVVTGATGLVGGAVLDRLVRAGHDVVGVARRPSRAVVPVVAADCADPEAMARLLHGADALVHVAGILLGVAMARLPLNSLARVVVVSSAGIYSTHRRSASFYAANEAALRAVDPSVVFVRPTMIYGSTRDRNVHHVISFVRRFGVVPLIGGGARKIQPIHYDDVAAVVAALVGRGSATTYEAGGAAPLSLRAAAEAIFAALGREARFIAVPAWLALAAADAADTVRGSRWKERIERMSEDRSVDNTALITATGIRPRAFADGVREEVAEMYGALR